MKLSNHIKQWSKKQKRTKKKDILVSPSSLLITESKERQEIRTALPTHLTPLIF
jgi:hypothetical protein